MGRLGGGGVGWAGVVRAAGGDVGGGTITAGGAGIDARLILRSTTDSFNSSTSSYSFFQAAESMVEGAGDGAVAIYFSNEPTFDLMVVSCLEVASECF